MGLFDVGARGGTDEVVHDRVLTVPNAITTLRLLGLPLFAWFLLGADRPAAAFWTLAAIASTDWVDGYVARRFDQVSRLGQLFDPLVDRALIATAGIVLVLAEIVPLWLILAILVRDAAVLGGALVLFGGIPPIPVTRTGKFATACLLAGLPSFLIASIDWVGATVFAWFAVLVTAVGVVTYYVAGVQYAIAAVRHRRSTPAAD